MPALAGTSQEAPTSVGGGSTSLCLIGRLVRDPEMRYSNSGKAVTSFTIAVNRRQKGEADFIKCITFDKQAENVAQCVAKGAQVAVEGRLQIRSYVDKDENKRTATEVLANSVTFLDSKKAAQESGEISEDDIPWQ